MGKPSKKTILKAIQNSGGVISTIAKRLDCAWSTAERWVKQYPDTARAFKDEEEKVLDMADMGLYAAIKKKEPWAIKWIQATKGKKRGYVEKQDIDLNANIDAKGKLKIKVIPPKPPNVR